MLLELTATLGVALATASFLRVGRRRRHLEAVSGREVRPFYSIPGPWGWPYIGTVREFMPGGKYEERFHVWMCDYKDRYGRIFKQNIFGMHMVVVCGPELADEMMKTDEKYPTLFLTANEPMLQQRRMRKESNGIVTSSGPEWKKIRSPWNHTMLKTAKVYSGLDQLNEIDTDFIEGVQGVRDQQGCVPDLAMELFRWSLESAGAFLFETRLGCLSREGNKMADEMIESVQTMFDTDEKLTTQSLLLSRIFNPSVYWAFQNSWDTIMKHGKSLVDAKIADIAQDKTDGVEPTGFLSSVIASGQLTAGEIYVSVGELLTAAVDTTSNTTHLILYELSRNPDVQQKLYDEITEVTGGAHPTADHLRKMDYLKATIKEVMRFYPAALGASRLVSEDTVIGGYHIPAGVLLFIPSYANARDKKLFDNPLELRPERWLDGNQVNTQAIPGFGVGTRGCIGQKTAEAEMYVLLIRLLQKFELRYGSDKEVELVTRTILVVKEPLSIIFVDRE